MKSIGPKSESRRQESRRVTNLSSLFAPRGSSRRMKRPETVDQFRKNAKAYQEQCRKEYFSGSDR